LTDGLENFIILPEGARVSSSLFRNWSAIMLFPLGLLLDEFKRRLKTKEALGSRG